MGCHLNSHPTAWLAPKRLLRFIGVAFEVRYGLLRIVGKHMVALMVAFT